MGELGLIVLVCSVYLLVMFVYERWQKPVS